MGEFSNENIGKDSNESGVQFTLDLSREYRRPRREHNALHATSANNRSDREGGSEVEKSGALGEMGRRKIPAEPIIRSRGEVVNPSGSETGRTAAVHRGASGQRASQTVPRAREGRGRID